jgi:cytochrome c oxidase subunit 3
VTEQLAGHFESLPRQAHAARLGMWIFPRDGGTSVRGLFVLYAAYRTEQPHGFAVGVENNTVVWGSVNTGVLLLSSYTIALAVHELRRGEQRACALLVATTIFLGMCFLAIKTGEYLEHFRAGLYPGGVGTFYRDHGEAGTKMFFTLYFCMTGLHAVHVLVGTAVLTFLLTNVLRRKINQRAAHPLAIGAIYWHLVDVIWIFLWPLFYLIPGSNP